MSTPEWPDAAVQPSPRPAPPGAVQIALELGNRPGWATALVPGEVAALCVAGRIVLQVTTEGIRYYGTVAAGD